MIENVKCCSSSHIQNKRDVFFSFFSTTELCCPAKPSQINYENGNCFTPANRLKQFPYPIRRHQPGLAVVAMQGIYLFFCATAFWQHCLYFWLGIGAWNTNQVTLLCSFCLLLLVVWRLLFAFMYDLAINGGGEEYIFIPVSHIEKKANILKILKAFLCFFSWKKFTGFAIVAICFLSG